MGTNYYAVKNRPTVCSPIHIGKSSYGWLFLFHEQSDPWREDEPTWHTYEEVRTWLYEHTVKEKDYVIMDEYDRIVSFDQFFEMVDIKQLDEISKSNEENFKYRVKNVNGYRFTDEEFS